VAGQHPGVRPRERPHPGAQLTLFETADGWRYTLWATSLPAGTRGWRGQAAYIDAGHRVHARVEDGIRTGKDCGIGKLPSSDMAINKAWPGAALMAAALLAWLRLIALDGTLARAEPKTLRYRVLHAGARLTRGGRRRILKRSRPAGPGPRPSSLPGSASRPSQRPADQQGPVPATRKGTKGAGGTPAPARQPGQCHALTLKSRSESRSGRPPSGSDSTP
jgi:hypothetical protein